ncbi:glutelin type-D 1-like [Tasmannia lanceolata]|uniref:glutelin type-D 1-like n=1 Tax=Tasmannia lanceolata TaxID=3420 RepID=UPI004062CE04
MEVDLSPKSPQKLYGSDGGSYYIWSSTDLPMLSEGKLGAAKLVLEQGGLALPHYADSSKIGYVLQGCGTVGVLSPEGPKEKVVELKQGDVIALHLGAVSWWYNGGDSEFVVVFLGDTSKAHVPGVFTYFFLAGTNGIFTGFSPEFLTKAWDLDEEEVNKLVKSQSGQIIVKLKQELQLPKPCLADTEGLVFNLNNKPFDVDVKNGGRVVVITSKNFPLLQEIGFSANLVKLDPNATCSPGFSAESGIQLTYIVKGSGRVEIVGINGKRVFEGRVLAGSLFVVPRFFVVSKIADGEGMEWFSVNTHPQPIYSHMAGKTSLLKALSPQVAEAAFNVTQDLVKLVQTKNNKHTIFFPPPH